MSPSEHTLSQQLAAFAAGVVADGAPEEVRASVRQRILDIVGLQAAALPLDTSQAVLGFVEAQGGPARAHVVGTDTLAPPGWAAFLNGSLAHSLDYDDTHLPSVLHPSASVVPAGLAAAEHHGVSGPVILDAVAVGIEVAVRLGMAGYDRETNDSVYFAHGQHATSICGTVASAVTASLLAGAGEDGVVDAIGVAASMASGIIEGNRTGGTIKRLHCGWAAHAGVTASELVAAGITGPPTALEGRFGLFEAFLHGRVATDEVVDGLGDQWAVPSIFFKPYPANHFTHSGLDAARRLADAGLTPDDVSEAVLGVAGSTARTIGEPLQVKQRPETGYQAQFSGPYLVAVGLFGGHGLGASLDDFTDELATDPDRRALMARIRVEADARCEEIYPYQFPAVLTVRTRDGRELVEEVLVNRGGPQDPLTDDELTEKFRGNALRSFDDTAADAVHAAVEALAVDGGAGAVLAPFATRPTVN